MTLEQRCPDQPANRPTSQFNVNHDFYLSLIFLANNPKAGKEGETARNSRASEKWARTDRRRRSMDRVNIYIPIRKGGYFGLSMAKWYV